MQLSWQVRREPNWLGLIPGVAAILILIGIFFLIRWYFRKDSGAPKWARRTLTIAGGLLWTFVFLNALTLGGLSAAVFGK